MRETVLQWNMGVCKESNPYRRRARIEALEAMVGEYSPGILSLQEAPLDLRSLRFLHPWYRLVEGPMGIVTGLLESRWQVVADHDEVKGRALVVKAYSSTGRLRLSLWNVHLPVVWKDLAARRTLVQSDFRDALIAVRKRGLGRSELLVGDFNLPPYDDAMVRRSGLYASRTLPSAEENALLHDPYNFPLFNPTWALLGKPGSPQGTFFRQPSPDDEGPWFLPDQALMSPDLALPGEQQVWLIEHTGKAELCSPAPTRRPERTTGSDHLPLRIVFQAR
ncbi:endonuclease/exonuclease/phosphatase family protein [Sorangium sp. So ce1153]|uniref:endonuclease/exonuclease/phosphatase family protein n=1 Tax=Sorangium sp. So ce1153 TaxID=3133333 RepID=UPI003F6445BD